MRLGGNAGGVGAFFMRFAECIYIYRADCGGGWGEDGSYLRSKRAPIKSKGLLTDKKLRTVQDASGERVEGTLNYRIRGAIYHTSEDDIGDADIILSEGQFWRVTSANKEGCDTVGSAVLLSDDECVDLGISR